MRFPFLFITTICSERTCTGYTIMSATPFGTIKSVWCFEPRRIGIRSVAFPLSFALAAFAFALAALANDWGNGVIASSVVAAPD